jgi:ATP-dependent Clp protease ATP-binding subunit ClpC
LVRHFEVVEIAPASEEEAIRVLTALKPKYEDFHGVVFGDGVIEAAVFASGRFLPHRRLPDRALDLLDDAGARVNVRRGQLPRDQVELQKRIRRTVRDMENAIASHEFLKAREYSDQEKQEREALQRLRAERKPSEDSANTITPADLEETIAESAGVPVSAVQDVLRQKKGKEMQAVLEKLAAGVSGDQHVWLPFLASYLAGRPAEEAARLAQAILQSKKS